ncbi:MAG: prepilin-type N-terminal cleavage/methylation domain-containing protein [Planctomycetes bacterium]|nr:prepilin-type N-terminal cleavage/methylation domain-containing protein [Planctomycetota bacterium]
MRRACDDRRRSDPRGFTLVEIMVVVAIIAIAARVVTANLGALIPATVLDSEARQIMGQIEFLRSEAQLQAKSFTLEFDLERSRWRVVLPPEETYVSTEALREAVPLQWKYLDERVKFGGFHRLGGQTARSGISRLVISENGFTTDSMIYLRMDNENLEYNVWTIRVFGLEHSTKLLTNVDGQEPRLDIVEEAAFQ